MKASLFLLGLLGLLSATCLLAAEAPHTGTHDCGMTSLTFDGVSKFDQAWEKTTLYHTATVANSVSSTSVSVNQIDPMAIVSISINGADYVQISGFGLSNPAFNLNVGQNTIKIMVDCMDCNIVTTIVITRGGGGVVGDPQFSGLKGQNYQVHGVAGEVYNIISDPRMQMNARFVFLNQGVCPVVGGVKQQNCYSHPGSYLGEIGIETAAGDKLELVSGPAETGYASVQLNGRSMQVGESVQLKDAYVSRNTTHLLTIEVSTFRIELESSDMFINQQIRVNDWQLVSKAHGLLGQTWNTKTYTGKIKEIEGQVDDYLVTEKELFGSNYVYNRFN